VKLDSSLPELGVKLHHAQVDGLSKLGRCERRRCPVLRRAVSSPGGAVSVELRIL
jgi:hypothetical protein